ncbi:MAG: hypothetical protein ABIH42_01510 [Planctomycetota bacterium]
MRKVLLWALVVFVIFGISAMAFTDDECKCGGKCGKHGPKKEKPAEQPKKEKLEKKTLESIRAIFALSAKLEKLKAEKANLDDIVNTEKEIINAKKLLKEKNIDWDKLTLIQRIKLDPGIENAAYRFCTFIKEKRKLEKSTEPEAKNQLAEVDKKFERVKNILKDHGIDPDKLLKNIKAEHQCSDKCKCKDKCECKGECEGTCIFADGAKWSCDYNDCSGPDCDGNCPMKGNCLCGGDECGCTGSTPDGKCSQPETKKACTGHCGDCPDGE